MGWVRSHFLTIGAAVTIAAVASAGYLQSTQIGLRAAILYAVSNIALLGAAVLLHRWFRLTRVANIVAVAAALNALGNFSLIHHPSSLRDVGVVFLSLPPAATFHAVLSLPTGRLSSRWERAVVVAIYVVCGAVIGLATLAAEPVATCTRCRPAIVHLATPVATALSTAGALGGACAAAAAVLILVRRFRRAGGAGRRLMRPVFAAAAFAGTVFVVGSLYTNSGDIPDLSFTAETWRGDLLVILECVAVSSLALAFPLGAWRASRAAGAFGRLAPRLGAEPAADELQQLLASALGDPSIVLDLDPEAVADVPAPSRALTDVTFGGTLLARLEHANPLLVDHEAFDTVVGTLGVLLGRRRLNAELAREPNALEESIDRSDPSREESLTQELRKLRDVFTSFVGVDLTDNVGNAFTGSTVEASIMFLDLRDFTARSEHQSPSEVVALLNSFWELVVPVVVKHGGHANRFIGDGLLAVFGAPESLVGHADHAMRAAVEIAQAVRQRYGDEIRIGIGINTGDVAADVVGGGGRYEFTVIGDAVNTASRVEAATRTTGDTILVTAETVKRAAGSHRIDSRGELTLRGKDAPVHVYALIATDHDVARDDALSGGSN